MRQVCPVSAGWRVKGSEVRDLAGRGQADGRHTPPEPIAWAPTRHDHRRPAPALGVGHPSAERLDAVAYGWLPGPAAPQVRAHAASCPRCGPRLASEEQPHQQLALLRDGEPRVDVVATVLEQLPLRAAGCARAPVAG